LFYKAVGSEEVGGAAVGQVANLFYKAVGSGKAGGGLRMGKQNDRIEELEKQIEDLMRRWPAHSVKPAMVQRLDELEEELKKAREKAKKNENENE